MNKQGKQAVVAAAAAHGRKGSSDDSDAISNNLWVGNLPPDVAESELLSLFSKHGPVDKITAHASRSYAFVYYRRVEDAKTALHALRGTVLHGNPLKIAFAKPQFHSYGGQKGGEGQPTNVLWIRYPNYVEIEERMLHNAMILFGEIDRLKCFPSRHCAVVEFRSMDEARRAKEGLQGRLFNDPRIMIMYSSSEHAPWREYPEFFTGVRGPMPEMYNKTPFQPACMEMLNRNYPGAPNTLSGRSPSGGIIGPNLQVRPSGRQGSYEPLLAGQDFNNSSGLHKLLDSGASTVLGASRWRRPSRAPGLLPSPPGMERASWEVSDAHQPQRESKRLRYEATLPVSDFPFPSREIDSRGLQDVHQFSPAGGRISTGGAGPGYPDKDYIWRGIIAKGGNPVCRARCVPIGKGIESEIPEVVNCSARTGLDMLTTHYADAIGFDIVFFLPDCEEDFASYTEFLNYLGGKRRAGVARFDNGTTLFLVPPSDFLSKVLNVVGPPRLYGVVLKFPQDAPSSTSTQQQSFHASDYIDEQKVLSQGEYSGNPQNKDMVLRIDHDKGDSLPQLKQLVSSTMDSFSMQPTDSGNTASVSQAGVKLTPELIASLTSLLPTGSKSFPAVTAQVPHGVSSMKPSFPGTNELDEGLRQGWTPDRQGPEQTAYNSKQLEDQYNSQQQLAQHQLYTTGLNTSFDSRQGGSAKGHVQNPANHMPQPGGISIRPLGSFGINSQGGQVAGSSQVNWQHQNEGLHNTLNGFGMAQGTDSLGSYGSSVHHQVAKSGAHFNFVHGSDVQQAQQASMLAPADNENFELQDKFQPLQTVNYGPSQETSGNDVDKNQRYQSTLQFAANLLYQIQQQQQQQTGTQSGQGSANS